MSSIEFPETTQTSKLGSFTPTVILEEQDPLTLQPLSQFEIYWQRFRSNKLSIIGLSVLAFMILVSIFAPLITPGITPNTLNLFLGFGSHPPTLQNFPWRIFGTTSDLNRSVLAEVTYGGRVSLVVGFGGALLSSFIGTIVGGFSGYFSGWVDNVLMRVTDIFLTIPFFPLLIAVSAIFVRGNNTNPTLIIVIFGVFGWAGIARLVRSLFLSLRELEYTEAARSVGINHTRIIFRHLLPNTMSPIIVATTLNVAGYIVLEATIDFLGIGITPPPNGLATWGNALSAASGDITLGDWWWPLFPGLILIITILAVSLIGDGLRDALDVRTNLD